MDYCSASAEPMSTAEFELLRRRRVALMLLIPSFDPSDPSLDTVETWTYKAEEIQKFFNITDQELTTIMVEKLCGEARVWYRSLNNKDRIQWRQKIVKQFPRRWTAPRRLYLLTERKYKKDENLIHYFRDKAALLRSLGISGRDAVESVVMEMGMMDIEVLAERHILDLKNFDRLRDIFLELEYNRTFKMTEKLTDEAGLTASMSMRTKEAIFQWKQENMRKYFDWIYSNMFILDDPFETKTESEQKPEQNQCKSTNSQAAATGCRNFHIPHNQDPNSGPLPNDPILSLGVEPSLRRQGRYFLAELDDRVCMRAYLDSTCQCIAIRRHEAVLFNIPYYELPADDRVWVRHYNDKDHSNYGPGCERPLGYIPLDVKVDEVKMRVTVYVVRTELLQVPMLIGSPFTDNPECMITECGGSVRVWETAQLVHDDVMNKTVLTEKKPIVSETYKEKMSLTPKKEPGCKEPSGNSSIVDSIETCHCKTKQSRVVYGNTNEKLIETTSTDNVKNIDDHNQREVTVASNDKRKVIVENLESKSESNVSQPDKIRVFRCDRKTCRIPHARDDTVCIRFFKTVDNQLVEDPSLYKWVPTVGVIKHVRLTNNPIFQTKQLRDNPQDDFEKTFPSKIRQLQNTDNMVYRYLHPICSHTSSSVKSVFRTKQLRDMPQDDSEKTFDSKPRQLQNTDDMDYYNVRPIRSNTNIINDQVDDHKQDEATDNTNIFQSRDRNVPNPTRRNLFDVHNDDRNVVDHKSDNVQDDGYKQLVANIVNSIQDPVKPIIDPETNQSYRDRLAEIFDPKINEWLDIKPTDIVPTIDEHESKLNLTSTSSDTDWSDMDDSENLVFLNRKKKVTAFDEVSHDEEERSSSDSDDSSDDFHQL